MLRNFCILLYLFACTLSAKEVDEMTLEEKVGQMFITYFDGETFNENAEVLINEVKIGGIIYYNWANGLTDPQKVKLLSENLQAHAMRKGHPLLFIAADQEGGRVARLTHGFTEFPGNAPLGIACDPSLAYDASKAMGLEIKEAGINLNFAPVADVNCNDENPVIGIRSFGADPENVAKLAKASVRGFMDAGVVPCIKHFPGHGDTTVDSHLGMPVVRKSKEEIEKMELIPFKHLSQTAPAVMTAHVRFEALDHDNVATFSPHIIQDILRNEFNYQGLVISDSITMGGAMDGKTSLYQAAINAIDAGNDIIVIGGRNLNSKIQNETGVDEIVRLYHGVLNAVRQGRIKESRLDESVKRILAVKNRIKGSSEVYNRKDHETLAKEIAYRSVSVKAGVVPIDLTGKNVLIVAPQIAADKITDTDLMSLGKSTMIYPFKDLNPTDDEIKKIKSVAEHTDYLVFFSYNAWKYDKQKELLQSIESKDATLIALAGPLDLSLTKVPENMIATYSPTKPSLQVVSEWMKGTVHPIDVSYEQAIEIGNKVWHNESRKRIDQLTFWNSSEPFPSVGIGHFIWPPKEYSGIFSDGRFHEVVRFIQNQGAQVPEWIIKSKYPPWSSRESFYNEFNEPKMAELRSFLVRTVPEQALYMVDRLNRAFASIVMHAKEDKRQHVANQFFRVAKTENGPYMLVDYLNFKHEGTNPKERYEGQGWGLLQVLESMQGEKSGLSPEQDFAESAKRVLIRRIVNSPNRDLEQKWMDGWTNRINTYLKVE